MERFHFAGVTTAPGRGEEISFEIALGHAVPSRFAICNLSPRVPRPFETTSAGQRYRRAWMRAWITRFPLINRSDAAGNVRTSGERKRERRSKKRTYYSTRCMPSRRNSPVTRKKFTNEPTASRCNGGSDCASVTVFFIRHLYVYVYGADRVVYFVLSLVR